MTTTAVIVQARMASTRLPGKVLLPLAGRSVLWHTLTRCAAVTGADLVCCAIPDDQSCEAIAAEAERAGAVVTRGPEADVLARHLAAATETGADIVLRVTSDCPVIDPGVCAAVLQARADAGADYACNNMPRRWPHGLDCEAFTRAALERAANNAGAPGDREHVTPWLRRDASVSRVHVPGPDAALARHRWTLDFTEDYRFFEALFAHLPPPPHIARFDEILAIVEAHPDIAALNAHRHPNAA
jgi:spore coat polysaccharide biosynthesis protein SpsF (cytidylyltransferase family)